MTKVLASEIVILISFNVGKFIANVDLNSNTFPSLLVETVLFG